MNISFLTLQRVIIAACSENRRKGIKESRAKFRGFFVKSRDIYTGHCD